MEWDYEIALGQQYPTIAIESVRNKYKHNISDIGAIKFAHKQSFK